MRRFMALRLTLFPVFSQRMLIQSSARFVTIGVSQDVDASCPLCHRFFQMPTTPPLPSDSVIEVMDDFDGLTFQWKPPSGGLVRYAVGGFLGLWLCGWAAAMVAAFTELMRQQGNEPFLWVWLAGWTLGGLFACSMLYLILRPPRPERVTLTRDSFRHDPGSIPFTMFTNQHQATLFVHAMARSVKERKPIEIDRDHLGPVRLDHLGGHQRLSFDHGADRIEIGPFLREPEREWLAAVIADWQAE